MSDTETETVTSDSSDYVDDDINDHYQGVMLQGKYVLLYKIGYGAFSTVWLSYLINDPQKVHYYAIKIQNPEDYEDAVVEVKTLQKLKRCNCPYILDLKESFEYFDPDSKEKKPAICMVFDLMACSVYQLIRRGKYEEGLPAHVVHKIAFQLLTALKYVHGNNLVHTDIKPENLLIKGRDVRVQQIINEVDKLNIPQRYNDMIEAEKVRQGCINAKNDRLKKVKKVAQKQLCDYIVAEMEPITATIIDSSEKIVNNIDDIDIVLSDFGTAFYVDELEPDARIQTRYYMSPEVLLQSGCNEKCDLWSVGCMLYEILTGDILFDPEKDRHHGRDYHHVYCISQICGNFPEGMVRRSPRKKEFFDKKGKLLGKRPEPFPIKEVINEYCTHDKDTQYYQHIVNVIESILKISPRDRPDVDTLLSQF